MSEAYVNYALHADGTLFELLEAEEEIGLISSQPAAPSLQTLFGLLRAGVCGAATSRG